MRRIDRTEVKQVAAFLARVFRLSPGEPFLDPELLAWKYLQPRPDWEGTRSFVTEDDRGIVSHFCLCPAVLRFGNREVRSMTAIDWAADRRKPGSGIRMFHLIKTRFDAIFAIGGSDATLAIIPRIGFRTVGEFVTWRKTVRPWAVFRSARERKGTAFLRLARDLPRSGIGTSLDGGGWRCIPVPRFDETQAVLMGNIPKTYTTCRRTVGALNYMLSCPSASFSAYLLENGSRNRGYLLMSRLRNEARIVDISIDSDDATEWQGAYTAATSAAAAFPEVHHVFAGGSVRLMEKALAGNGYRRYRTDPVMIYDPLEILSSMPAIAFQMFEGDAGYYQDSA